MSIPISFRVAMDTALFIWQGGMPMMRQLLCRGLILGAFVVGSTGCETLHSMVRSNDKDEVSKKDDKDDTASPTAVESDGSKYKSIDSNSSSSQPFFSRNRSSSSFSSFSPEAQSIEKSLGVY
jgi:hypothetical protein